MILSFAKDDTSLYTNKIGILAFSNVKSCLFELELWLSW